jgi:hypothetical protein
VHFGDDANEESQNEKQQNEESQNEGQQKEESQNERQQKEESQNERQQKEKSQTEESQSGGQPTETIITAQENDDLGLVVSVREHMNTSKSTEDLSFHIESSNESIIPSGLQLHVEKENAPSAASNNNSQKSSSSEETPSVQETVSRKTRKPKKQRRVSRNSNSLEAKEVRPPTPPNEQETNDHKYVKFSTPSTSPESSGEKAHRSESVHDDESPTNAAPDVAVVQPQGNDDSREGPFSGALRYFVSLIRALLSILHGLFSSPTEQQPEQGEKLD